MTQAYLCILQLLLERLEVVGAFYVLPSLILVSFGAPVSASSETVRGPAWLLVEGMAEDSALTTRW